jgi:4-hydroxy-tetrahydrodipicolinate reductase
VSTQPQGAPPPIRVAVLGVTGRMGQCLLRAIEEAGAGQPPPFELVGALAAPGLPELGRDAGEAAGLGRRFGVEVTADRAVALERADVAIDFTNVGATLANVAACVERGCALMLGTTGLEGAHHAALDVAASRIPLVQAANTSLGVNLLLTLVERAAASLPPDYDIEIVEAHHRHKVDAPSGTALRLGEAAAAGRGAPLSELRAAPHEGITGPRREGSIGFAVVRGGDIVGDHTVVYAGPGERIELGHRAHDRMTFAHGALRAARWLHGRPAGRYTMRDVLGLS